MTIKAKWDKLFHRDKNTYMWVFVGGNMFVINEAEYEQNKELKNKKIHENNMNEEKERNK